uniref:Uncharacterized protein n=1 Tax=Triticum urartu TaxID=4572 RepID=A0A8R7V4K1_TRIUA
MPPSERPRPRRQDRLFPASHRPRHLQHHPTPGVVPRVGRRAPRRRHGPSPGVVHHRPPPPGEHPLGRARLPPRCALGRLLPLPRPLLHALGPVVLDDAAPARRRAGLPRAPRRHAGLPLALRLAARVPRRGPPLGARAPLGRAHQQGHLPRRPRRRLRPADGRPARLPRRRLRARLQLALPRRPPRRWRVRGQLPSHGGQDHPPQPAPAPGRRRQRWGRRRQQPQRQRRRQQPQRQRGQRQQRRQQRQRRHGDHGGEGRVGERPDGGGGGGRGAEQQRGEDGDPGEGRDVRGERGGAPVQDEHRPGRRGPRRDGHHRQPQRRRRLDHLPHRHRRGVRRGVPGAGHRVPQHGGRGKGAGGGAAGERGHGGGVPLRRRRPPGRALRALLPAVLPRVRPLRHGGPRLRQRRRGAPGVRARRRRAGPGPVERAHGAVPGRPEPGHGLRRAQLHRGGLAGAARQRRRHPHLPRPAVGRVRAGGGHRVLPGPARGPRRVDRLAWRGAGPRRHGVLRGVRERGGRRRHGRARGLGRVPRDGLRRGRPVRRRQVHLRRRLARRHLLPLRPRHLNYVRWISRIQRLILNCYRVNFGKMFSKFC